MSYDHVYLSPHLDDAVFSCGGTIAMQRARGERVLVVTVCAGIPDDAAEPPPLLADPLRALGITAADLVRHRRAEDRAAMEALGVDYAWEGSLDAPFRLSAYGSISGLLGPVAPGDPLTDACRALAATIAPGALLHAPLGVGNHVDHRIVFEAALAAGRPLRLYEDFPYAANDVHALPRRLDTLSSFSLEGELVLVADTLERRVEAAARYASQIPSAEEFGALIRMHTARVGDGTPAERFFRIVRQ